MGAAPFGLLLDVDGRHGVPVAFDTGRSVAFVHDAGAALLTELVEQVQQVKQVKRLG